MRDRIKIIDSHTAGEPTRVVVEGFPDLQKGSMAERLENMRTSFDQLRNAIVNEPRGHSAIVGALLFEPLDTANDAGVIFFNNVGYLNMCGHGLIGLIKTLDFLGLLSRNEVQIETPVGVVSASIDESGKISFENVASYRFQSGVQINVPGFGMVKGDIAWGGNWFFLVENHEIDLSLDNLQSLLNYSSSIRDALEAKSIFGNEGAEIDHIEINGKSPNGGNRNFVLCPGFEYDRSPCGTGTSAKMACLFEDEKLSENEIWRQESIIGSVFEGSIKRVGKDLIPRIKGEAHIMAESELIFGESDPYRFGFERV